ncbi:MAG TPA: CoA transferase, partial [Acidimicrobiales bacterium]
RHRQESNTRRVPSTPATLLFICASACSTRGPDGEAWDRPHLDGGQHGTGALYRLYRTQDDGWICIAAEREEHWRALCRALDVPTHFDERLSVRLQAAFLTRTALAWSRRLDAAGVPNEIPVDTVEGQTLFHDDDNVRHGVRARRRLHQPLRQLNIPRLSGFH